MLDAQALQNARIDDLAAKVIKPRQRLSYELTLGEYALTASDLINLISIHRLDLGRLCVEVFSEGLVHNLGMINALQRCNTVLFFKLSEFP